MRAFLEVAHCGSLSRAAIALGSSQPTLSRQIAQLEAHLGSALFERTTRGVRLTEVGAALRVPAELMREQALAGTVRITASEGFCRNKPALVTCRRFRRQDEDDDDPGTAQGDQADALPAGGNAHVRAVVRGLSAEPASR